MDQGTFDFKPRTRATDPATSHRAEARMRRSELMASQRGVAQLLVDRYGPATATELAALSMPHDFAACLGADVVSRRYALCRRLPELVAVVALDAPYRRERVWRSVESARVDVKDCCGAPLQQECYSRCSSRNEGEES